MKRKKRCVRIHRFIYRARACKRMHVQATLESACGPFFECTLTAEDGRTDGRMAGYGEGGCRIAQNS